MSFFKHNIYLLLIIFISFIIALIFAYVATQRSFTPLENLMLQFITLSIGLIGSFVFGKYSARDTVKEMIKPHARSAFRRLKSLYQSLSRVAFIISKAQEKNSSQEDKMALAKIEAILVDQISTADDAMEDWHDLMPEDVEDLYKSKVFINSSLQQIKKEGQ